MTNSTPYGDSAASARRRGITLVLGATGLAVAVVAGVSACGSTSGSSSAASSGSAAASSSAEPGKGMHRGHGVMGTIASENADTWTLTKKDGTTETVTITPQTTFGSKKNPAQKSQFTVGENVVVRGQESGSTVTASAIMQAKARPAATSPSASAAAPAPTTN